MSIESIRAAVAGIKRRFGNAAAEEVCDAGCVADVMISAAVRSGVSLRACKVNLGDGIVTHGTREQLMHLHGIDAAGIVKAAKELGNGEAET